MQLEIIAHEVAAKKAALMAKVHGALVLFGAWIVESASTIVDAVNHSTAWLPSVQGYLTTEWVHYIGLAVSAASFVSAFGEARHAKASARVAGQIADAWNAAPPTPAAVVPDPAKPTEPANG